MKRLTLILSIALTVYGCTYPPKNSFDENLSFSQKEEMKYRQLLADGNRFADRNGHLKWYDDFEDILDYLTEHTRISDRWVLFLEINAYGSMTNHSFVYEEETTGVCKRIEFKQFFDADFDNEATQSSIVQNCSKLFSFIKTTMGERNYYLDNSSDLLHGGRSYMTVYDDKKLSHIGLYNYEAHVLRAPEHAKSIKNWDRKDYDPIWEMIFKFKQTKVNPD